MEEVLIYSISPLHNFNLDRNESNFAAKSFHYHSVLNMQFLYWPSSTFTDGACENEFLPKGTNFDTACAILTMIIESLRRTT